MLKKWAISPFVLSLVFSSLHGLTLKESVNEAINTNPVVQERLKNYRATQQDLNIADSEYYPSLDLRTSVGATQQGSFKNGSDSDWNHNVDKNTYGNYESSLTLTQNLFEGFSTMNKVDYQEARILAAAYNYIERSNDIAFKMTTAYLNVLRAYELLQNARENVKINEDIFLKVKDLYDAGLTTDSEVKKIESALSLSKSNLTVQKNNTNATEYNFRRVLGRMPNKASLEKPSLEIPMPQSLERASLYAINHNPSLLVSNYNIKGAQSLYKQHKKEYYPKIDLEVSQAYSDYQSQPAIDIADDRFQARVVMSYNFFRGGADAAAVQKDVSLINQEVEIKRDLKRQVIEGIDLSWNSYVMIDLQLKDLRDYSDFSQKTLELFKEEYDLGRRSLLDLLFAQNDVINSRAQIINAEYDYLLAKYRILDAMGLLPLAIIGDTKGFSAKVNLYNDAQASEVLDTVPVKFDVDNDNVLDNQDLCDNSRLENNIMPYGCEKMLKDSKATYAQTQKNVKVSADGSILDVDMDGIKDEQDKCLETPMGHNVDAEGCSVFVNLGVNFEYASNDIDKTSLANIETFAVFMEKNPEYKIKVIGHTSSDGDPQRNIIRSQERAEVVKNKLIELGVSAQKIESQGRGASEPIAENSTQEGMRLNRRVVVELTK